jgi:hypothetical protein
MNWTSALASAALLLVPTFASTQSTRTDAARALARADSAYSAGDHANARVLYAEVLARDSMQSRAVFRLAQLENSGQNALALYRRYIALEPGDPWGHMATGDRLAQMGLLHEALEAYDAARVLAPGERDVAIGRARVLDRGGHPDRATTELLPWVAAHNDDGEAWDLLGRMRMRSGRPKSAAHAFERAVHLNVTGADGRLARARAMAAPALSPEVTSLGDSDGNRTTRFGGLIDFMVADGARLGALVQRDVITSESAPTTPGPPRTLLDQVEGTDLRLQASARPTPQVNLSMQAGTARFERSTRGAVPWTAFRSEARMRARMPRNGASIDVRVEHAPMAFNPLLVDHHVVRSEARAMVEVPIATLRLRGIGRVGRFEANGEAPNSRAGAEAAVLLPLGGGRVQPSLHYRSVGFQRASAAGYFAPRRAETTEAGLSVDGGDNGRISLTAELGAGLQRVAEHGGVPGPWSRAWRAWSQASLSLGPSRVWFVELEAYDAPFAVEGVSTTSGWRYLSLNSGLRWALR